MGMMDTYKIDLLSSGLGGKTFEYEEGDDFFAETEGLIQRGTIHTTVVCLSADSVYKFRIHSVGTVIVLEEKLKVPGPGWERFPKRMEVNVTITGEKGMISCDCFGPTVYHNGAPNDRYTVQYTYFDEWVGLIDEFVDCIRNHKTPLINLKWHKETIQAMLGCYESIQSGKIAKVA